MEYKTQDDYEQRAKKQDRARVFEAVALSMNKPDEDLNYDYVAFEAERLIQHRDAFAKQEASHETQD